MDYSTIILETTGGVATLTMNRPDRLNGMTNRMLWETYHALSALAVDPEVRVLVLTGAGKGFCPGADLDELAEPDAEYELQAAWFNVPVLLHEMPAVTVAAVNGACAGAGFGWAAACDVRFVSRRAKFNTAFLDVGVAGDMGLPWSLPRLVGPTRARSLSFFPRKFTADEAYDWGLATEVFDDEDFRAEVASRVDRLAAAKPIALRTMKLQYTAAERLGYGDYLALETSRHLDLVQKADPNAAFAALNSRRDPAAVS